MPGSLERRASGLHARLPRANGSEGKSRSKLELARRVDRVCDLSERKALLLHTSNARHAWVSQLRLVGDVIGGDIKAECFVFSERERFVKGEVEIARAHGAHVVQIGRGGSGNEWIHRAAVLCS